MLQDGIIIKGHKAVIPSTLRSEYYDEVHGGCPGTEATLERAQNMIYWPGMTRYIREKTELCAICNSLTPAPAGSLPSMISTGRRYL